MADKHQPNIKKNKEKIKKKSIVKAIKILLKKKKTKIEKKVREPHEILSEGEKQILAEYRRKYYEMRKKLKSLSIWFWFLAKRAKMEWSGSGLG